MAAETLGELSQQSRTYELFLWVDTNQAPDKTEKQVDQLVTDLRVMVEQQQQEPIDQVKLTVMRNDAKTMRASVRASVETRALRTARASAEAPVREALAAAFSENGMAARDASVKLEELNALLFEKKRAGELPPYGLIADDDQYDVCQPIAHLAGGVVTSGDMDDVSLADYFDDDDEETYGALGEDPARAFPDSMPQDLLTVEDD